MTSIRKLGSATVRLLTRGAERCGKQATETENPDGASCQGRPAGSIENDDSTNNSESHNSIGHGSPTTVAQQFERQRRGDHDLRDLDQHYSWRQVYRSCEVEGYGHE